MDDPNHRTHSNVDMRSRVVGVGRTRRGALVKEEDFDTKLLKLFAEIIRPLFFEWELRLEDQGRAPELREADGIYDIYDRYPRMAGDADKCLIKILFNAPPVGENPQDRMKRMPIVLVRNALAMDRLSLWSLDLWREEPCYVLCDEFVLAKVTTRRLGASLRRIIEAALRGQRLVSSRSPR